MITVPNPLADNVRQLLEDFDAYDVVAEAGNGEEAVRLAAETKPDIVLLDIRMPGLGGLELQQELLGRGNTVPIIFITGHGDVPMAVEAMQKGVVSQSVDDFYYLARACLVKDESKLDLFDRIFAAYFQGVGDDFADLLADVPDEWLRQRAELPEAERPPRLGKSARHVLMRVAVGDAISCGHSACHPSQLSATSTSRGRSRASCSVTTSASCSVVV